MRTNFSQDTTYQMVSAQQQMIQALQQELQMLKAENDQLRERPVVMALILIQNQNG
jgi:cell division protein FtsB